MKKEKNHTKEQFRTLQNHSFDLIIESTREGYNNKLESFEVYSQRVKEQLNKDYDNFIERIAHGFEVISKEL